MDIHPLIVHFPVALLTLYSIAEFLRFKNIHQQPLLFGIKTIMVAFGTLGAGIALLTGETAEHIQLMRANNPTLKHIINIHSDWAAVATLIYGVIALAYISTAIEKTGFLAYVDERIKLNNNLNKLCNLFFARIVPAANHLVESRIIILLALLGLAAITITGALGGSIMYGTSADPIVWAIYKILGL